MRAVTVRNPCCLVERAVVVLALGLDEPALASVPNLKDNSATIQAHLQEVILVLANGILH